MEHIVVVFALSTSLTHVVNGYVRSDEDILLAFHQQQLKITRLEEKTERLEKLVQLQYQEIGRQDRQNKLHDRLIQNLRQVIAGQSRENKIQTKETKQQASLIKTLQTHVEDRDRYIVNLKDNLTSQITRMCARDKLVGSLLKGQKLKDFKILCNKIHKINYELVKRSSWCCMQNSSIESCAKSCTNLRPCCVQNFAEEKRYEERRLHSNAKTHRTLHSNAKTHRTEVTVQESEQLPVSINERSQQDQMAFYAYFRGSLRTYRDYQTLVFDVVRTNVGGHYTYNTGIFTAPSYGVYCFTWTVVSASLSYSFTELVVNSNVYGSIQSNSETTREIHMASGFVVVEVNAGDKVFVRATRGIGVLIFSDGQRRTSFSGWNIN